MAEEATAATPGAGVGAMITTLVIVALLPWFLIGGRFLNIEVLVGGVLLGWYWLNVENADRSRIPASIIGALVGIAIAWAALYLATNHGVPGIFIGLGIMIVAIWLDIVGWLPLATNKATMLFLTIAAAPIVQLHVDFPQLAISTLVGGLYFMAFTEVVKWAATKRNS